VSYGPRTMEVADRIMAHAERLTVTERRVADVVSRDPQAVAFGTVAQVAGKANTSGPSVVRLAVKLGYTGFVELQAAVQSELAARLGPASHRIHERTSQDLPGAVRKAEHDNLTATFDGLDPAVLDTAVRHLVDPARQVWVLTGEVTGPVGAFLAAQLGALRPGVTHLTGSATTIGRSLAGASAGDVLMVIDIHRYERLVLDVVAVGRRRGMAVVAVTDGPLSPLAAPPACVFMFAASGVGPFDSMSSAMALVNLLVTAAAATLRTGAAARLDAVERMWGDLSAVVVDAGRPASHAHRPPEADPAHDGTGEGVIVADHVGALDVAGT
jgi:DNA-binding MurR/RpiR family transcriptional regulator